MSTEFAPSNPPTETAPLAAVQRVLVPLDGAEFSRQILPLLRGFFIVGEVELVLFGAADACCELEADADELRAAGFSVKVQCAEGDAARAIIHYVASARIDMIAIASQAGRLAAGTDRPTGVSEKVLRNVNVPVLLMRAAE